VPCCRDKETRCLTFQATQSAKGWHLTARYQAGYLLLSMLPHSFTSQRTVDFLSGVVRESREVAPAAAGVLEYVGKAKNSK
jgi:hypothetical protein